MWSTSLPGLSPLLCQSHMKLISLSTVSCPEPIGSMSSMEVNVDMLEQMDLMDMSDHEALDVFLHSGGEDNSAASPVTGRLNLYHLNDNSCSTQFQNWNNFLHWRERCEGLRHHLYMSASTDSSSSSKKYLIQVNLCSVLYVFWQAVSPLSNERNVNLMVLQ